jgi:hypothetical protein
MNDKRKKVVGLGLLVICVFSMIYAYDERESPSLGWMLAWGTTWALAVWLWPEKYSRLPNVDWKIGKRRIHIAAIWALVIGFWGGVIILILNAETTPQKPKRDYLKDAMSGMTNDMRLEEERANRIRAQELNDDLHRRHPELGPAPTIPKGAYEKLDDILKSK